MEGAFGMEPLPRWVTLTVLFVLTVAVMACIGQGVARAFVQFEALEAYRLDILGSIGGIVVFSVLAFLQLPPIVWGSIAAALLVVLLGWRPQLLGLLVVVVVLGIQSAAPDDQWSPYYKVTAKHAETQMVGGIEARDTLTISANNIPHQTAYDVETLLHLQPFYAFPYRHLDACVARPGPHRRSRERQRRGGGVGPGRQAHRCGRDRPGHPGPGVALPPEPPVPGPAG